MQTLVYGVRLYEKNAISLGPFGIIWHSKHRIQSTLCDWSRDRQTSLNEFIRHPN